MQEAMDYENYQQQKLLVETVKKEAADAQNKYQQFRRDTAIADSLRSAGAACSDEYAQSLLSHLIGDAPEQEIPKKMDQILQSPTYKQIFFPGQQQTQPTTAKPEPQRPRFSREDLRRGRFKDAIDLIAKGLADVY